MHTFSVFYSFF